MAGGPEGLILMRIAMLVNNLDVSGGYQKLVLRLGVEFLKKNHEVCIYTASLNREACYPEMINDLTVKTPKKEHTAIGRFHKLLDGLTGPFREAQKFRELANIVDTNFDALIIHDNYMLYTLSALKISSESKVVWMLNNEMPEGFELPPSRNCYGMGADGLVKTVKYTRWYLAKWLEWRAITKGLDKVGSIAVYDEYNRREVTRRLRIPVVNVHAGADIRENVKTNHQRTSEVIRVVSVGVMFPHRRYEDLVEAVALARKRGLDVQATIVGRRDLCPEYSRVITHLVHKLGCQAFVKFKDHVSDKELVELYSGADIFCFVNDGKTWGIAVFEAVAARIPVIISNNIGAADLLVNGQSAWMVRPRAPMEIVAAIEDIANHPKKALTATNRAAEVLPLVTWDSYTSRMLNLLN